MKLPKRLISMLLLIVLLTGCGKTNNLIDNSDNQSIDSQKTIESVDETPIDSISDGNETTEESVPVNTQSDTPSSETASNEKTTKNDAESSSTKQSETTKPVETTSEQPTTSTNDTPPSSTTPELPNATAADAEAIANKIIAYINELRSEQGVGTMSKLLGLTKVAQYRSNQLITNYSHDINSMREATKAHQYGEHIVYDDGAGFKLDYYECHAGEAIGRSGGNASVDEIAQRMANGFKDSANHWSYVGAARNKYIAVGASYGNGQWYICILTSEINTYG